MAFSFHKDTIHIFAGRWTQVCSCEGDHCVAYEEFVPTSLAIPDMSSSFFLDGLWDWRWVDLKVLFILGWVLLSGFFFKKLYVAFLCRSYGFFFPGEIITAILMLYNDPKSVVVPRNGDCYLFHIIIRVLQVVTLTSFLFLICSHYILGMVNPSNTLENINL